MKFFKWDKDGGPESKVSGFFIVEIKNLFSIVWLHFKDGSRDAYHKHAFGALSWLFKGVLIEKTIGGTTYLRVPSLLPIWTPRKRFHKVTSLGDSYVLSFRGPWAKTWKEWTPVGGTKTLTWGRKVVS